MRARCDSLPTVGSLARAASRPARCVVAVVLVAGALVGCSSGGGGPVRIGVMLPLTGPDAVGFRAPLEWARENVNAAGGVGGRPLELVYRDTARQPVAGVAASLARDTSIVAAIGPDTSQDARHAAATFTKARK